MKIIRLLCMMSLLLPVGAWAQGDEDDTETDDEELLDEVVVSTRGSRTVRRLPTRVELLSQEEIDEKVSMKPGDIRMMLSETTGILTQQTSATSGNALIRIQGLDGRYTQVLKDGFPVFAGAASGLGLLQTPPLDLRQVEVIKGSSSTLYGGGAIAGLVNLISKTPTDDRELTLQVNGTTAGGLDVNGFYGQRFGTLGTTVFASYNSSQAYDPSETGFSAIPQYHRVTFNPKLFLYLSPRTDGYLGVSAMYEDRLGGAMDYIRRRDRETAYFERNKTSRHSVQMDVQHRFADQRRLRLKASATYYDRSIALPDYEFEGTQWSSFSELAYSHDAGGSEWVGGLNLWTDRFSEPERDLHDARSYVQNTVGAFVQNNTDLGPWFALEAGLRIDHVNRYGWAVLPRLSLLLKSPTHFTSRLGGGMGYKAPSIFTEESERIAFRGVRPVSPERNRMERSWGANWDFNYATGLWDDNVTFSLNHLFFYTRLDHTLLMQPMPDGGGFCLNNIDGHTDARGWETNVKLGWGDLHYYLGYTYTDVRTTDAGVTRTNVLTPRHRLNHVLMYEVEERWKVGVEAYYYSPQRLSDGATGRSYWLCGLMAERMWEHLSIYVNLENFTDRRQTRFDTIYTGPHTAPEWRDIYAPLDGFVANAGIKVRL